MPGSQAQLDYNAQRRRGSTPAPTADSFGLADLAARVSETLPSLGSTTRESLEAILATQPRLAAAEFDAFRRYAPETVNVVANAARRQMPSLLDLQNRLLRTGRESTLRDIEELSPQLTRISQASEGPEATAARSELQRQIFGDLALGRELGADEIRDVQQSMRAGEVARGLGTGQGSANRESVQRALSGRDLQRKRQQSAAALLQLEKSLRPDPFTTVGNLSTQGVSNAQNMFGAGIGATPTGMNTAFQTAGLGQQQQQIQQQSGLQALQAALGAQFLPQYLG